LVLLMLRWMLKIAAIVVLGVIAVVLYADLQSIHQISRITPAIINRAPDDVPSEDCKRIWKTAM
jgi:hypothetical protein